MRRVAATIVGSLTLLVVCAGAFSARDQTTVTRPIAPAAQTSRGQVPPRANAPQTGTAIIRGRVTAADGTPLRRAQVTLRGGPLAEPRIVATDERGQYEIANLPPGSFTFSAAKGGYLTLSYGQRRPGETARPFDVANGQSLTGIDFYLPRGGVIAVQVMDEAGNPLADVGVQAHQYRFTQGVRGLALIVAGGSPLGGTNDRGEHRLYGLAPGDYYISASFRGANAAVPADRRLSYAPTYYPGTTREADAERVSVGIGEERTIAIRMPAVRLARISGVIQSSSGGPLRRMSISLDRYTPNSSSLRGTRVQPDGSFTFTNVVPGDYFINILQGVTAEAAASPDASEYAMFPVTVSGDDVTGLVVTAMKPGSASGRVVFDTDPGSVRPGAVPILANIPMRLPSGAGSPSNGRWTWKDDWTFEVTNLTESRLIRLPAQAQGWFLKAVMLDGKDVTDIPLDFTHAKEIRGLEIVLTRKQTQIGGNVVNENGQPVTEYAVVVYAEDSALRGSQTRFIAAGRPNQQGRFTISGLPPGRYLAAAVEYLEIGSETDRDLLARLESRAVPLTLGEGESRAVSLRITN